MSSRYETLKDTANASKKYYLSQIQFVIIVENVTNSKKFKKTSFPFRI